MSVRYNRSVLLFILLFISEAILLAQDIDTALRKTVSNSDKLNAFEVRGGFDERIEIEYRHLWLSFVSSDLTVGIGHYDGINVGLSLFPLPFIVVQPSVGIANWHELIIDAAELQPEYVYKFRGGMLIPVGNVQDGFYLSLTAGTATLVDNNYCYNCGFRPAGDFEPLKYRTERRTINSFSFGLGVKF
ncbi:MAG: hypothetical protein HY707_00105 [Ignavibacteriae bacterium]|nr:hypothetical protein [Ignavibacteriota bacterium]